MRIDAAPFSVRTRRSRAAIFVLLTLGLTVFPAVDAAAATPTCFGYTATIVGTSNGDDIEGTNGSGTGTDNPASGCEEIDSIP
jgi:hypothetical protein